MPTFLGKSILGADGVVFAFVARISMDLGPTIRTQIRTNQDIVNDWFVHTQTVCGGKKTQGSCVVGFGIATKWFGHKVWMRGLGETTMVGCTVAWFWGKRDGLGALLGVGFGGGGNMMVCVGETTKAGGCVVVRGFRETTRFYVCGFGENDKGLGVVLRKTTRVYVCGFGENGQGICVWV